MRAVCTHCGRRRIIVATWFSDGYPAHIVGRGMSLTRLRENAARIAEARRATA